VESLLPRIRDIAVAVFDSKLSETPVQTFGINFNYHRRTRSPDVGAWFGRQAGRVSIGVNATDFTSAQFRLHRTSSSGVVTLRIEPSVVSPNVVFVAYNFHYEVPPPKGNVERLYLAAAIDAHLRADWAEAKAGRDAVVAAIDADVGGS
jgi:hypothetical protein